MRARLTRNFMQTLEHLQSSNTAAPVLTMESIAFQHNDPFCQVLEAVVGEFVDLAKKPEGQVLIEKNTYLKSKFIEMIMGRFGLNIELITDGYLCSVIPNTLVPHNPMIRDTLAANYEKYGWGGIDSVKKLKNNTFLGTVDTKNAKVSGWFSKPTVPLFINFFDLVDYYKHTVKEIAASILHEIGHAFQACLYVANVNTTNQILADVVTHLHENDYKADIGYVYKKIKNLTGDKAAQISEGLASGNRVVLGISTYRLLMHSTRSLMSDKTYDRTSFEAMSDHFVSRFGYGTEFIRALERAEGVYSENEYYRDNWEATLWQLGLFTVGWVLSLGILLAGSAIVIGGLGIFVFSYLSYLTTLDQRTSTKEHTYDDIKQRYLRIRAQLVQSIKSPKISSKTRILVLSQITEADKIISDKLVFQSFVGKVTDVVFFSDARAVKSIRNQQECEQMIANDLFISANRLMI